MIEKNGRTWTSEELLATYTQPITPENQEINNKLNELVDKVTSNLINTYGMLPDPRDIDIHSVTKDDKTYLVVGGFLICNINVRYQLQMQERGK